MENQFSDKVHLLVVSEFNNSSFFYRAFRIGGLAFMAICCLSYFDVPLGRIELLSSITIGLFGLMLFFYFPISDKLRIYNHKIEIYSFYGKIKIINRKDIVSINEIIKPTRFGNFRLLEIKTINRKYNISEIRYTNYEKIKIVLMSIK